MKKILIACEESQQITVEMRKHGLEAYSCDIIPCSGGHPEWHIQDNVLNHLEDGWDMMIAHPPCTYLSTAGNAWFNIDKYGERAIERHKKREHAFNFVMQLAESDIKYVAIENPQGFLNTHWRKPDQVINPFQFGDPERKRTCLWLKNLPLLKSTKIVLPKIYGEYKTGKSKGQKIYFHGVVRRNKNRGQVRSKTFPGIAQAIVKQWGSILKIEG